MDNTKVLPMSIMKNNIGAMVNTVSDLKLNIVRSLIHKTSIPNNEYVSPQLYIDSFIEGWDDVAEEVKNSFKKVSINDIHNSIVSYNVVEGYASTSHDFASVLQFANGIFSGIKEGKFNSKSDINDFFDHTITHAFNKLPHSVGGLMDGMMQAYINKHMPSNEDVKVYNSAVHKKLINENANSQLRNSIKKTIEFLVRRVNNPEPLPCSMELYTHGVNRIFDYIIYSLAAYAVRINILGTYCRSFNPSMIVESVIDTKRVFTVLSDADDIITSDPSYVYKFLDTFKKFIVSIGAQKYFPKNTVGKPQDFHSGYNYKLSYLGAENSEFINSLADNDLYSFIIKNYFGATTDNDNPFHVDNNNPFHTGGKEVDINYTLKSLSYGDTANNSESSRQDLINKIVNYKLGETAKELGYDAKGFYIFAVLFLKQLASFKSWNVTIDNPPAVENDDAALNNIIKMVKEIYIDISVALLNKGREIENKLNILYNKENDFDDMMDSHLAKLNDRQQKMSDVNLAFVGASENREDEEDINEFYMYPYLDEISIYNENMKMNPLFKDETFIFEAVDGGTPTSEMDRFKAAVKALWDKIKNFFSNAQFTNAANWVAKYRANIEALKPEMEDMVMDKVVNYKASITLPTDLEKCLQQLGNIPDAAFTDKKAMDEWVKSLYPSGTYDWFANNQDNCYKNLILFQEPGNVNNNDVASQTIQLKAGEVPTHLDEWISNLLNYNDVYRQWMGLQKVVDTGMSKLDAKVKQFTARAGQQAQTAENNAQPQKTSTDAAANNNPGTPPAAAGQTQQGTGGTP